MFGKILVNEPEFQLLKQKVNDLEERFFKQEIEEIMENLEVCTDTELHLDYDWYRHNAIITAKGVYDRNFATLAYDNYGDLVITLKRERENIINAIKSYLYDKKKEEEILYGKV